MLLIHNEFEKGCYLMPSVKKNSLFNFILVFSNILFPFVSAPYISRVLNIADIGLINKGAALSTLFVNVCSFGLLGYGTREIARVRDNPQRLQITFSSILFSHLLIVAMGTFVYVFYTVHFVTDNITKKIYFLYLALLLVSPFTIEWFYTGLEKFKYISIRSIAIKVLSLVALFIFVKNKNDFYIYGVLLVLATGLNSLFNIVHAKKYISLTLKGISLKKVIWDSRYFYLQTLVAICYQNINQLILGKDYTELAFFVRATTIVTILDIVISPVMNAVKPRLAYIYASDFSKYSYYVNKTFNYTFCLAFPCAFGLALLGNNVMYLLGGEQFLRGGPVVSILALSKIITIIAVFLNEIISTPSGNEKNTFYSNFAVAIVACICNPFAIAKFGAIGAASILMLAESVGVITHLILIHKEKLYLHCFSWKKTKYVLAALLMALALYYIRHSINGIYMQLIICIPVGAVIYGTLLWLLSKLYDDEINEVEEIFSLGFHFLKKPRR